MRSTVSGIEAGHDIQPTELVSRTKLFSARSRKSLVVFGFGETRAMATA
jgi:hypothetical protein